MCPVVHRHWAGTRLWSTSWVEGYEGSGHTKWRLRAGVAGVELVTRERDFGGDGDGLTTVSAVELQRYRMMAESTSDLVLRVRLDGVIEWVSPSVAEVLGFAPEDLVGRRNLEVVHPDHRERFLAEARAVVESGADARFEFPVVRADGSSVWMESVGRLADDSPDGESYRVVRLRNIDSQHAAQQALADSEELFRLAMANAPTGMCLIAPDGAFLSVNAALCDLLGRDEAALRATTWQAIPIGCSTTASSTSSSAALYCCSSSRGLR